MLHSFGRGTDGINGAVDWISQGSLIMDAAGNLYGMTTYGGIHGCWDYDQDAGCGTVFELSPKQDGGWTEKVLHSFGSGTDGAYPYGGLISDAAGNLNGTAGGGDVGWGTVFELTPNLDGGWTALVRHNFGRGGADGAIPVRSPISDAAGNLYGTTYWGGIHQCSNNWGSFGCGTVFKIMPYFAPEGVGNSESRRSLLILG